MNSEEQRREPGEGGSQARQLSPDTTPVFHVMSRDVVCVAPRMRVEELCAVLLENSISGAPVVDEAGRLVGIVSTTDVVRDRHERQGTGEVESRPRDARRGRLRGFHLHDPGAAVEEVMSRKVVTVTESTSLARAAWLMAHHHVHRLPVLDAQGRVSGLVSSLDVLGWVAGLS